jgi:hypothetical protein
MRYYLQAKTNTLHLRRNCGMTRRTRYGHFEIDLTPEGTACYSKCRKCCPEARRLNSD